MIPPNKTPRDVSGDELAKRLSALGYVVTRQRGDHMRLTSNRLSKQHSITIPRHGFIKIGTLKEILRDVAEHQQFSRERLLEILFD